LVLQLKYKLGIAEYLPGLGAVAAAGGNHAQPARLLAAAANLLSGLGALLEPPDRAEYEHGVAASRAGLSEAAFAEAWAEGRAMALDDAVHYALGPEAANPPRKAQPSDPAIHPSI